MTRIRRCPACNLQMTRWGGRLYCVRIGCEGSITDRRTHPDLRPDEKSMLLQLRLPGTEVTG